LQYDWPRPNDRRILGGWLEGPQLPALRQLARNQSWAMILSVILLVVAVIFGGASRVDVASTMVVQLAALACLVLILCLKGPPLTLTSGVVIFSLCAALLPLLQLVPLPWSLWSGLPGRELARSLFETLGTTPAMPLSINPSRTVDSALSVIVPFVMLLLVAQTSVRERTILLRWLLGLGVVSAVIGMLQIAAGPTSRLYMYAVTNSDASVGFFANANHMGLFLASMLIVAMVLAGDSSTRSSKTKRGRALWYLLAIPVLVAGVFGADSRAGMGLAVLSLIAGAALIPYSRLKVRKPLLYAALGATALALTGIILLATDNLPFATMLGQNVGSDQRFMMLPVFQTIARDFFPFGAGFGSFEMVFKSYETPEILDTAYLNHAHNDYAQLLIEGGAPGLLLLLAFLFWFGRQAIALWSMRQAADTAVRQKLIAAVIILLILLHSAVDYPIRTTTMAALFALCVGLLLPPPLRRTDRVEGLSSHPLSV
jgi:O-antigen ligase